MATRDELRDWVLQALDAMGGEAPIVQVAKYIWDNHAQELQASGDLFYTWQHDMRWGATKLRDKGVIVPGSRTTKGRWRLNRREDDLRTARRAS